MSLERAFNVDVKFRFCHKLIQWVKSYGGGKVEKRVFRFDLEIDWVNDLGGISHKLIVVPQCVLYHAQ